ncbi:MAG: hypothetical protein KDA70_19330 [Planctomycetaceae bacterium]|nr:hypothetical protein [Planctomycetaceae bacterium]
MSSFSQTGIAGSMEIRIDFEISKKWNNNVSQLDVPSLSKSDLHYHIFLGDLILIINDIDCSARWGWIPLLDLATALHDIRKNLAGVRRGSEIFEFTECEAAIHFERNESHIAISNHYPPQCTQVISFEQFDKTVTAFCNKVFQESLNLIPALESNAYYQELRRLTVRHE